MAKIYNAPNLNIVVGNGLNLLQFERFFPLFYYGI